MASARTNSESSLPKVMIFDMDDTVLLCNEAYTQSREALSRFVLTRCPHTTDEEIRAVFTTHDRIALENHQVGHDIYPQTMVTTYKAIADTYGIRITKKDLETVLDIGRAVFEFDYAPYPGALKMLQRYKRLGVKLGLCTRGDAITQMPKIHRWGLQNIFHKIEIVSKKTPEIFLEIIAELDPSALPANLRQGSSPQAWVIGDSRRHEITAGLAAGLHTIHVHPTLTAHHDEGVEAASHHTLDNITDLPTIIPFPVKKRSIAR